MTPSATRQTIRLLFLAGLGTLAACTTVGSGTHHDPTLRDGEDKPGSKDEASLAPGTTAPGAQAPVAPVAPPRIVEPPPPSVDEQLAFLRKQSAPGGMFTDRDRQFVAQLPSSPQPGSVTEAALAIGLVRVVLNPLGGDVTTFKEADFGKGQPVVPPPPGQVGPAAPGTSVAAPGAHPPSLEQLCHEKNLNLPDALSENPLLGTAGIAKQVLNAIAQVAVSVDFKNEVSGALKKQESLWSEISGSAAGASGAGAPGAAGGPPPDGALQPLAQPAPVAGAAAGAVPDDGAPPNPAELAGGDAVLAEAQALADRGNYQAAIKRAGSVPDGSPLKPQAQDKVRDFSNLAVQDLRKKAASAFQSAMPVNDPKTRGDYLKQAQSFLEEAIKDYPDATQLPTVRDNLRVISRDLEQLDGQKKGE